MIKKIEVKMVPLSAGLENITDPAEILKGVGKFTLTMTAECDIQFAQRLAKLIESETKGGKKFKPAAKLPD